MELPKMQIGIDELNQLCGLRRTEGELYTFDLDFDLYAKDGQRIAALQLLGCTGSFAQNQVDELCKDPHPMGCHLRVLSCKEIVHKPAERYVEDTVRNRLEELPHSLPVVHARYRAKHATEMLGHDRVSIMHEYHICVLPMRRQQGNPPES